MIHELDSVVLTHGIPEHGLVEGDVGAVAHVYGNGATFEVEFVAAEGTTVALLTLDREEIRPMARREILHVRELAAARQ